jgi:hypothetical protein
VGPRVIWFVDRRVSWTINTHRAAGRKAWGGAFMAWGVLALAVVAFVAYTAWLNAAPARCPSWRRVNVLRRTRTGRRREECDSEGALLRSSAECVCPCCGARYWVAWDDFEGRHASPPSPRDDGA